MFETEGIEADTGWIPAQYAGIVSETLDLKNDVEFGYFIPRTGMSYNELLGSRAYQRALNHVKAVENDRMRQEAKMRNAQNPH